MGIAAFFISKGIYKLVHSYAISVLITIVIAVIIYGVMLLLLKVLDAEEVYAMPGGAKLYALAKKLHLM